MEVPDHKRTQYETIQSQIEDFLEKKTIETVEQGKIKPQSEMPFSINNEALLKLREKGVK